MKPRKQIVLEESEAPELSVADRLKILKTTLADPSTPASAMAGINRQISALENNVVPGTYVRVGATGVEAVEKRKLLKTPLPEPKPVSTPLWVLRAELVESVATVYSSGLCCLRKSKLTGFSLHNLPPSKCCDWRKI